MSITSPTTPGSIGHTPTAHDRSSRERTALAYPSIPMAIVLAAVLFNPLLAFINGNIRPLSALPVMACEVAIVGAAHLYAIANFDRRMRIWYAYLGLVAAFMLIRSLGSGAVEIRYFRDLLMIPTFVVLGMVSNQRQIITTMLFLMSIVVAGVLLEAGATDTFSSIFQVKDYYINTRGMVSDEFTNEGSTLFVSATRPEARFFPFFELHRLSSIFLEPVSLGNFAIIAVAFTMAFWPRLNGSARLFLILSILLVLFACDGRLSAIASLAVLAIGAMSRILPRNIALIFLPVVTTATIAASLIGDFKIGTDDLQGRLAHTQHYLAQMSLADFLGASNLLLPEAEDSGIIYIILTQSIFGVMAWWLMIVCGLPEKSAVHQNYKNAICVYMPLIMMVSFAFVTIKTAAPMWFVYGFLAGRGGDALSRSMNSESEHQKHASPLR